MNDKLSEIAKELLSAAEKGGFRVIFEPLQRPLEPPAQTVRKPLRSLLKRLHKSL